MLAFNARWLGPRRCACDARVIRHPVEQMGCREDQPIVLVAFLRIEVSNQQAEGAASCMAMISERRQRVNEDPTPRSQGLGIYA